MSEELNNEKTSVTEMAPEHKPLFSEESKKKKSGTKKAIAGATVAGAASLTGKTIVLFSVLGAVLLALSVALVLVIVIKPFEGTDPPKFDVWEGEDTYGNAAHLAYPLIEEDTVTKMDIYVSGEEYSFIKYWDENMGKYDWRIEGIEQIDLDATAFEMLRMWLCTVPTQTPVRNITNEKMVEYGLDKEKENGYTVYYNSDSGEKSYTVRIGEKTSASGDYYYAYIEGRNHAYKFLADLVTYSQYPKIKYLSPTINTFFSGETQALMGIDKFDIYLTDGSNTSLKNVITIKAKDRTETSVSFEAIYGVDEFGRRRTTVANSTYASSVFASLYLTFVGSEVVCIMPTEDDLREFGLDSETEKYFINVEFADNASFASASYKNKEPSLYISREMGEYHYVLSQYYGEKVVVKVLKSSLSFLGEESHDLFQWTDVNSITTGFYESITQDEDSVGLKEITVKTGTNEETFYLSYDSSKDELTVTCKNRDLVFKDDNNKTGFERNVFRNLYVYMLYFPFINSFNATSDEATLEFIKPENVIYSITAVRNDNSAVRYTYYKKDANFAIESIENGKLKNGELIWDAPTYGNIVTTEQISLVTNAIDIVLKGEYLLPDEDVLA